MAPAADLVVTVLVPAVVGRVFVREGELVEVSPALDLAALGPTHEETVSNNTQYTLISAHLMHMYFIRHSFSL